MTIRCRVLLVSGSLRSGSTNTALLRTVQVVAPQGIVTVFYEGLDRLPHFNPDHDADPLHPAVADLRSTVQASDAILFSTPDTQGRCPGRSRISWTGPWEMTSRAPSTRCSQGRRQLGGRGYGRKGPDGPAEKLRGSGRHPRLRRDRPQRPRA
jgi:hypothetical protein